MTNPGFVRSSAGTLLAQVVSLVLGVGTSVILARVLGPEGRGVYALAMLLPSLVVTLGNMGIGAATVYFTASRGFPKPEILGSNIVLAAIVGTGGVLAAALLAHLFGEVLFPGVAQAYLLLAAVLVPVEIFFSYTRYLLLGAQRIKEFNYIQIAHSTVFLGLVAVSLLAVEGYVPGAILASVLSWVLVDILVFHLAKRAAGGITLAPNAAYMKRAISYGLLAHATNILWFFNYRVDLLLVNGYLGATAVGLYSVGVGLVEKLWLVSQAASTVLFPRVAAETEENRRKEFTPLVARTVLWATASGTIGVFWISRWAIILLYSEAFLPAVGALQVLLPGIASLGVGRVLANDIAGRGLPGLNAVTGAAAVGANVLLNVLWIPRYGIVGAAWASTVSYTVSFLITLIFYCRLSGNRWTAVVFPQRGDWALYWKTGQTLIRWAMAKVRGGPR